MGKTTAVNEILRINVRQKKKWQIEINKIQLLLVSTN